MKKQSLIKTGLAILFIASSVIHVQAQGGTEVTIYAEDPNNNEGFKEDLDGAEIDIYRLTDEMNVLTEPYADLKIPQTDDAGEWMEFGQKAIKTSVLDVRDTPYMEKIKGGNKVSIPEGLYLTVIHTKDKGKEEWCKQGERIYTIVKGEKNTYFYMPEILYVRGTEPISINLKPEKQEQGSSAETKQPTKPAKSEISDKQQGKEALKSKENIKTGIEEMERQERNRRILFAAEGMVVLLSIVLLVRKKEED